MELTKNTYLQFEAALPTEKAGIKDTICAIDEQLRELTNQKRDYKVKASIATSKNSRQAHIKEIRIIEAAMLRAKDEKRKQNQALIDLDNKLQRLKNRYNEAQSELADIVSQINQIKPQLKSLQDSERDLAKAAGVPDEYLDSVIVKPTGAGGYRFLFGEAPNDGEIIMTAGGTIVPIKKPKVYFSF